MRLKAITVDQWKSVLQAIEDSEMQNRQWERDYAIVFLGGALGMRVGEICLYERKHFRDFEKHDIIHAPTLKQSEKIQFTCHHCERVCRVKLDMSGKEFKCSKCNKTGRVPEVKSKTVDGIPEVDIDMVEPETSGFILDYLKNKMRKDQRFLFEGRTKGYHISSGHVNRIFNTFASAAGLDPQISFHSLRHCRGVRVYSLFKDMVACKLALRHKNIATTQIYANLDQEQLQRYKAKLSETAFDPMKKLKKSSQKKSQKDNDAD